MNRTPIAGTFNGTGAALYLCLGFIPDWFRGWNLETTNEERVVWSINDRSVEMIEGIGKNDDGDIDPLSYGQGIVPYQGGDIMAAAVTNYIAQDPSPDKRSSGTGSIIDTWTLGSSANRTGNWNDVCSTTYVGEGSRINIDGVEYTVVALTSNGEAANEVTLNVAVTSGTIEALTGMYDYIGLASGAIAPAGLLINSTTFNASGELCRFEAGCYS